jgi:hypothetical protein
VVVVTELAGALALLATAHSWAAVALAVIAALVTAIGFVIARERGHLAAPTCPLPPTDDRAKQPTARQGPPVSTTAI